MFGHVKHLLSAYCHGQLSPDESCWVARHVRECARCRIEYERIRLGVDLAENIGTVAAPESLWSEIEAALDDPAKLPAAEPRASVWDWRGLRPAWPTVAAAMATLVLGLWMGQAMLPRPRGPFIGEPDQVRILRPQPQPMMVNLASYVDPVQAAPRTESIRAITSAPPEFQPCETERLAGLGLSRVLEERPLPGFELLEQRIHDYRGLPVTQFVYSSEGQAFSVFVAPRQVRFSFGDEYLKDATVGGIRCRQVDCPYQRTYEFEGANRFVLVSKALDEQRSAQVMRYFLRAEQDAH
jgi:hypothetical protein